MAMPRVALLLPSTWSVAADVRTRRRGWPGNTRLLCSLLPQLLELSATASPDLLLHVLHRARDLARGTRHRRMRTLSRFRCGVAGGHGYVRARASPGLRSKIMLVAVMAMREGVGRSLF